MDFYIITVTGYTGWSKYGSEMNRRNEAGAGDLLTCQVLVFHSCDMPTNCPKRINFPTCQKKDKLPACPKKPSYLILSHYFHESLYLRGMHYSPMTMALKIWLQSQLFPLALLKSSINSQKVVLRCSIQSFSFVEVKSSLVRTWLFWHHPFLYGSVWSFMVLYVPLWSCMVPYDHLWSCMVPYDPM